MAIPPLIPWEPSVFPAEIVSELNRRKINRGLSYVVSTKDSGWSDKNGDWSKYRGPMSPWVRFCSNGAGKLNKEKNMYDKQGFVLFGGKGFYSEYGFGTTNGEPNRSIIGYLPDGKTPHVVENDLKTSDYPIHVPAPEIEKISVTIQKELYRRASVEWVCFSKAQLEYMTPYFLIPGISCILEWGWNLYNPECLLNLNDVPALKKHNDNPYPLYTKHILGSNGNYDVLFGRVTHFEWSAEGNKFKCRTEITSQDRIYAGLVVDSKTEVKEKDANGEEISSSPFGSFAKFVAEALPKFREVESVDEADQIPLLGGICKYIRKHHPDNADDYIYGVFFGRNPAQMKDTDQYDNKHEDFDRKAQNKELWINLGLAIECINYHHRLLRTFNKKVEIFRIDIDKVVINAHPNLISCDGSVLLIPNAMAPKYFSGTLGTIAKEDVGLVSALFGKRADFSVMRNASVETKPIVKRKIAEAEKRLYDYRLFRLCQQEGGIYRDNLDEIINRIRYWNTGLYKYNAFPFINPRPNSSGKPQPAFFSGYLKDLYINTTYLKQLTESSDIQTYTQLIEKMMSDISAAAGGFWDFRLTSGTGEGDQKPGEPATMKIVDYNFINTSNRGTPYTFDYFDADSLFLGMSFKPTLSNAQAIRTIYAQTNQPDSNVTLTNGDNELLDYKFKDRLNLDAKDDPPPIDKRGDDEHFETMRSLQQISPKEGSYQMTTKYNGKPLIRRLVLPSPDILKMLLDDGDEEQNPKYCGVMPNIQASFTIQGIGGLRTFMMFLVRNLPEPYSHENVVFRIVDVQESIEVGKWTTTITAGLIPLREHIKLRLGIPAKSKK